jgi:hypothetical protein
MSLPSFILDIDQSRYGWENSSFLLDKQPNKDSGFFPLRLALRRLTPTCAKPTYDVLRYADLRQLALRRLMPTCVKPTYDDLRYAGLRQLALHQLTPTCAMPTYANLC